MIACCRRTPYFISKYIRTFCSTKTLLVKTKVRHGGVDVAEYWNDKTTTFGMEYQMIQIDKTNHRVLMITNPRIGPHHAYFSIRIGVGSNDDDLMKLRPGLAHLLEHVAIKGPSNTTPKKYYVAANTYDENTIYTIKAPVEDFFGILEIWATNLFSSSLKIIKWYNIKSIVKTERKRVDEEFHEKRFLDPTFNHYKLQAILKARDMVMPDFQWGNLTTLKKDGKHDVELLIEELDKLRDLYRHRPVFLCVYVPWKHDESPFYDSWIRYLLPTEPPKQTKEMNLKARNPSDCTGRLFVVRSDADLLQFRMYFPLNKWLNLNESRTFKFFLHLLKARDEGSLTDYLVKNKLGTHCETYFVTPWPDVHVTINLTEDGLKDIQKIINAVIEYIKFLVHEWPKLDAYKRRFFFNRRTNFEQKSFIGYTKYIARRFDANSDKFDESDLFQTSNDTSEQDLIKEHVLANKNVIYSIVTRDINEVASVLDLENGEDGNEVYYDTKYRVFTKEFKRNEDPVDAVFKIVDMENHKIPAVINASEDVVYQKLCIENVESQCGHLLCRSDKLKGNSRFHVNTNGIVYGSLEHGLDPTIKKCLNELKPFTMNDAQFRHVKKLVMRNLSTELTNSEKLARSLLRTAVTNVHSRRKVVPIPIQYNTLRTMEVTNYNDHFKYLKDKEELQQIIDDMENNDRLHTEDEFDAYIMIKSINYNQSSTLTYHFYEVKADDDQIQRLMDEMTEDIYFNIRQKKEIYTANCWKENFGHCEGIVLKAWSVESHSQVFTMMQDLLKNVMEFEFFIRLKTKFDSELRLPDVYNYMIKRSIQIQIVGHEEIADNESKIAYEKSNFEKAFVHWFKNHEKKFEKFIDITKKKPSNP